MIRKSYIFLGASFIVYLLLLYITPFLSSSLVGNLFAEAIYLHIPSIILSSFGIYYGIKGSRKEKMSAKVIWSIALNIILMTYLFFAFSFSILVAFLFFFEIPL